MNTLPIITDLLDALVAALAADPFWATVTPIYPTDQTRAALTDGLTIEITSNKPADNVPVTNNTIELQLTTAAMFDPSVPERAYTATAEQRTLTTAWQSVLTAYPGSALATGTDPTPTALPVYHHINPLTISIDPVTQGTMLSITTDLVIQFP